MLSSGIRRFGAIGLISFSGLSGCARQPETSAEALVSSQQALNSRLNELSANNSNLVAELRKLRQAIPDYSHPSIAPALACAVGVLDRGSFRSGVIFSVNYGEGSMKVLTSFHAFSDVLSELSAASSEGDLTLRAQKFFAVSSKVKLNIAVRVKGTEARVPGLIVAADPTLDLVAVKVSIPSGFSPSWAEPIRAEPTAGTAALLVGSPSGFSQIVAGGLFSDARTGADSLSKDLQLAVISLPSSHGDSGAPVFAWDKESGKWGWAGLLYGSPLGVSPIRFKVERGLDVGSLPDEKSHSFIDAAGVQWGATNGLSSVILIKDIAHFLDLSKSL